MWNHDGPAKTRRRSCDVLTRDAGRWTEGSEPPRPAVSSTSGPLGAGPGDRSPAPVGKYVAPNLSPLPRRRGLCPQKILQQSLLSTSGSSSKQIGGA